MAWIESHQELRGHPKTKKLVRILDVSLPAAIGLLHCLWWWAMDYASDGNLSRYDSGDLADACGWVEEPQKVVNALIESGFLLETHDGLFIHDWHDYAGRLIEKREQNKERKKMSRARHAPVTRPSQEIPHDGRESHRATEPYLTEPYLTIPKPIKEYVPVPEIIPKQKKKEKDIVDGYTSNPKLIETLNSFIEFRKKIKKPLTDKAISLLLGNLDKLATSDEDKVSILEQSIFNGWQGVFALKDKGVIKNSVNGRNTENPHAGIDFGF